MNKVTVEIVKFGICVFVPIGFLVYANLPAVVREGQDSGSKPSSLRQFNLSDEVRRLSEEAGRGKPQPSRPQDK